MKAATRVKGSDMYERGRDAFVDAREIAAIVPVHYACHSFRAPQEMADIVLKSGVKIESIDSAGHLAGEWRKELADHAKAP
jgi:hypothetical protein